MTSVDYRTIGRGPGLLVIPGTTRRAHHYAKLAAALADTFTVHVIERRGRGASPPTDDEYSLETEVADALDVLDETGTEQIFGHSYGGLIALHVALRRNLESLFAYEPAIPLTGAFPLDWLDGFDRRLRAGQRARAVTHFMTRVGYMPASPLMAPAMYLMMRITGDGRDLRKLVPSIGREVRQVRAAASDGSRYATITTPTRLIGGGRSPAFHREINDALSAILPAAKAYIISDLDHNGPDVSGPEKVAAAIRA